MYNKFQVPGSSSRFKVSRLTIPNACQLLTFFPSVLDTIAFHYCLKAIIRMTADGADL